MYALLFEPKDEGTLDLIEKVSRESGAAAVKREDYTVFVAADSECIDKLLGRLRRQIPQLGRIYRFVR